METITYLSKVEVRAEDLVSLAIATGLTDVRVGSGWVQVGLPDRGFCTFERSVPSPTDIEYRALEDAERDCIHALGARTWYRIEHHVVSFPYIIPILQALLHRYDGWLFLGEFRVHSGFAQQNFGEFEKAYAKYMKD